MPVFQMALCLAAQWIGALFFFVYIDIKIHVLCEMGGFYHCSLVIFYPLNIINKLLLLSFFILFSQIPQLQIYQELDGIKFLFTTSKYSKNVAGGTVLRFFSTGSYDTSNIAVCFTGVHTWAVKMDQFELLRRTRRDIFWISVLFFLKKKKRELINCHPRWCGRPIRLQADLGRSQVNPN